MSTQPEVLGRDCVIERADGAIVTLPPQVEFKGKVTLFIDVYEARLTKVIWKGACTETLSGNTSKDEERLERAVGTCRRSRQRQKRPKWRCFIPALTCPSPGAVIRPKHPSVKSATDEDIVGRTPC